MNKKVALHTLGCKLNFSETSTIGKQFLDRGFEIVDFKNRADVYLINTCTVTGNADRECRQIVRRALRQNPTAHIIVTGCYAQLNPEEIAGIEGVDTVLGNNEKFKLFSIIKDFNKRDLSCTFVSPINQLNDFGAAYSTDADSRTRAYLKIQDGCDYKCTFCTIPLARGNSRSMNPEDALDKFNSLVNSGYKEIILTGVNVGDYGKHIGKDLYSLLLKMVEVPGKFRIRISSIEPNLLTDDIIALTADNEKMCRHFHIPLQSGCSEVLKFMQRRYTVSFYSSLIEKLKYKIPDIGIGVDVIVGTPGETEIHFKETQNFLNDLQISYLHVFTYSERPNTKAIELNGSVDNWERKRRNKILRILSDKKKHSFYNEMLGNELEVLFESENSINTIKGFSSNYVRVENIYIPELANNFNTVKILEVNSDICKGEIMGINKPVDLLEG
ncbi:MAG: tRNA (N(6)-L-threonylcarbamoyladenosine(37)-C(2))-methylthiotransferase MtaB [Bacteroidetes bacterium]|nr:tRNA (N(6)-L-threonylcarbamoyladenosine(37)-C(2))-methylthiotransferase MtaB [Bacteroidota bacterium]MCH8942467.1 tRNA (N(6)-L-threonylcarbamoyladenosine(37)-C(2))-methylthiotransferase MtaB [Bacteroidota bacterium]